MSDMPEPVERVTMGRGHQGVPKCHCVTSAWGKTTRSHDVECLLSGVEGFQMTALHFDMSWCQNVAQGVGRRLRVLPWFARPQASKADFGV